MKVQVSAHITNHPDDVTDPELVKAISVALRRVYVIREGSVPIGCNIQVQHIHFGEGATS